VTRLARAAALTLAAAALAAAAAALRLIDRWVWRDTRIDHPWPENAYDRGARC
jgi:hypothetical protein